MQEEALPPESVKLRWQIIVVFLAALALRLFHLGQQNFWYDEILTLQTAGVPWGELVQDLGLVESSNPPLYFSLIHLLHLSSASEFLVRLPSSLFGAGACVVAFLVGRRLLGDRPGIVVGLLMTFSPMQVWYSQEARMYALLQLCGCLTFWFLLRFITSGKRCDLLGYGLSALLSCYTFIYGFFILPFCCLIFVCSPAARMSVRRWGFGLSNLVVGGLFAPWLFVALNNMHSARGLQFTKAPALQSFLYSASVLGLGSSLGPPIHSLQSSKLQAYFQVPAASLLLVLGLVLLTVLTCRGLAQLFRSNRMAFFFSLIGLLVFLGGPAIINLVKPVVTNNARYAMLSAVPLYLAVAAGLSRRGRLSSVDHLLGYALTIVFLASLRNHYFLAEYAKLDCRGAALFISRHNSASSPVIVFPSYLAPVLEHYEQERNPVRGMALAGTEADAEVLHEIRGQLDAHQSLALVYARPDHGDPKRTLFNEISKFAAVNDTWNAPGIQALILKPK